GMAASNATVTLTIDGISPITVTANNGGNWNYSPTGLADGVHTIVASSGSGSIALTFTLDTTAPSAPSLTSVTDDVAPVTGTLAARVTDQAGNQSAVSTNSFTVTEDTTPPNAPVISGIIPDSGTSSSDGITNQATVTVSGTAEANSTLKLFDGATLVSSATT